MRWWRRSERPHPAVDSDHGAGPRPRRRPAPASTTGAAIGQPSAYASLVAHARRSEARGLRHARRRPTACAARESVAGGPERSERARPAGVPGRVRSVDGWVKVLLPVLPNGTDRMGARGRRDGRRRSVTRYASSLRHASDHRVRARARCSARVRSRSARRLRPHRRAVSPCGRCSQAPTTADGLRAVRVRSVEPLAVDHGASRGGDDEIGIHGNNDASVLGRAVTLGSVRMDNDEITKLAAVASRSGTPVDISR